MKLTDIINITGTASKTDRAVEGTVRIGLDFSIALFGYLNDWFFPIMIRPSLRGIYVQVLFLGVFIGRLREVSSAD